MVMHYEVELIQSQFVTLFDLNILSEKSVFQGGGLFSPGTNRREYSMRHRSPNPAFS